MKQFILILVAVLVGGFLALLGYDQLVVEPRAAAAAQAEAAALTKSQPDMKRARSEAKEVTAEVEAAVQRSVDNARQAFDAGLRSAG